MTLDGGSLIYWASTLHSHHWPTNIADEEAPVLPSVPMSSTVSSPEPKPSVPTSKANLGTELMLEYVTESSLATPEQHPLVIRPVYKEIETRLLQHIKQKQEEPERRAPGLLIFGHSGTGEFCCERRLTLQASPSVSGTCSSPCSVSAAMFSGRPLPNGKFCLLRMALRTALPLMSQRT